MRLVPSAIGRKYGYSRSQHRNLFAARYQRMAISLPSSVDLQPLCPPVYDQGQLGSCTANAIAAAYQFERMQANLPPLTPSRLFIYWNERVMENDTNEDAGAFGGDGITSLETLGVPDESLWPYIEGQFSVRPPDSVFAAALANKISQRKIITTIEDIKGALVDRHLVPFGISLYESFESDEVATSGIVPDPTLNEGLLGGHETAIAGYDDSMKAFKVRNSWGSGWGQQGYCWINYDYVMAAGSDFEVITKL